MEEVNNSTTADSNLSLDVFSDLAKQENFEEKLDTLSEEAVNNMITKAVDNADEQDTETISDILQNSETSITSKIIDTATNSEENKNVVTDALVDVAKEDPDKVKEILVESEKDTTTTNTDENKTKIYGAGGFGLTSPYHHKDTGTPYNPAGFDKYGNINPASGSDPNWVTEPTFSESYTTADTISISASATSSPAPNGIKYSAKDLPPGVDIMSTGIISGTPTTAGTYTGEIIATDKVNVARQITSAFSFTVTEACGPYDANGFNAAGYHRNGTIYDDEDYDIDGYNRYGFNAADEYDPLYDENVSRA